MSEILSILLGIVVLFSVGASLGLFSRGKKINAYFSFIPSSLGSFLTIVLSFYVFASNDFKASFFSIQNLFDFEIFIDGFAAFFLLIIGLISLSVSIYSISYSKKLDDRKNNSSLGMIFNIFIVSMIMVVISNNVYFFLLFWELMSLSSFFLIIYEHENKDNLKSGLTYLVMTHLGTGLIFASFLLMHSQTGSLSFDSFRDSGTIPQFVRDIVFVLAFVGFGTKAGIVPLHSWLPQAHPSAPSNISALMSTIMLNTAIYGIARYLFDYNFINGIEFSWWGITMIVAGSVSALVGILYTLIDNDIKRALAFSSIENIGIIFIGMGLSVVFASYNLMSLSLIAFIASMFHVLNHSLFKGLLFMAAGSVHYSTHSKNMEELGGLIKKMPWTALMFLIGSIAIIGLPPLNGFISEWLTLQSLLAVFQIPSNILQVSLAFAIMAFSLVMGLAMAAFVKIFGITFLSKARSSNALNAVEVPRLMLIGKTILTASCILFGILPFLGINLIVTAFDLSTIKLNPFDAVSLANTLDGNNASLMMPSLIIVLFSSFVGIFVFTRIMGGKKKVSKYRTWDCGFGSSSEITQYTATSLVEPIRRIFGTFYQPVDTVDAEYYAKENQHLKKSIRVNSSTKNVFEEKLYSKVISSSLYVLGKIRKIQTGKINAYILYIMITLVSLLLFVGFGNNG